ncbi:amidohydrolase family protein [Streptomyces sp. NPDC001100]
MSSSMPVGSTMPVGGIRPHDGVRHPAQLVVRNGRIHTGDPARAAASAVAITDGVFGAVGHDATVAPHIGPDTRVVDALGRRVIPGLKEMYTSAGAHLTGEADVKGTITEGKCGDLAILSADYFSVADEDIDRIESLVTVAGGKVVHAAGITRTSPPRSRRSAPPGARSPASAASRRRRAYGRPVPSPTRPPTPRSSAPGANGAATSTTYRPCRTNSAVRSTRWTVASDRLAYLHSRPSTSPSGAAP